MEFLNSNPNFIYGVEIGVLWARIYHGKEYILNELIHTQNAEQCVALAKFFGLSYSIRKHVEGWIVFETFGKTPIQTKATISDPVPPKGNRSFKD